LSDIVNTHNEPELAAGATFLLAGLATLILILAAMAAGKSLWVILAVWVVGGPLILIALMLALTLGEVLANAHGTGSLDDLSCDAGGKHV
jgi:hypothetical protein